ncbi:MAG: hypothetical protein C0594_08325, partial [Marinilabiliales bacterium]
SIENGVSPYTYNWDNGSTGNSISELTAGNYNLTVTDANNCTHIETITVIAGTGIGSIDLSEVSIYPNPTNGIVKVEIGDLDVDKIELVNILGENLEIQDVTDSTTVLNLENYESGIYFIKLITEKGEFAYKITLE